MKPEEKKELASALLEAMDREDMHNREAGACLNMNPNYISMMKNEKLWPSVPQKAWTRAEEWMNTRGRLKDFVIPEGEELLPIKVPAKVTETMPELGQKEEKAFLAGLGPEEHSPEAVEGVASSQAPRNDRGHKGKVKKEKNGRSVVLEIYKHEVAELRQKVAFLEEDKKVYFESCQALSERIAELEKKLQFEMSSGYWIVRITELEKKIEAMEKPTGKLSFPGFARIAIFQRINYGKL